ncbi:MAG: protein-glutamate O-methyltransferase CheR [Alphaproteobacteria bacterium]|nr:protein-glutamate O-methyltransferase CheR [Alphaproteobacteria bacterium]
MHITDFDIYKDLLKQKSGLVLTQDKSYLLDSRLNPVAKKWGYENIEAMTKVLRGVPPADLVTDIIEAMTTNETSFFRDIKPFETFKDTVLKYYKENPNHNRKLRIWCAASSSGQEPYSIAMILKEKSVEMPGWSFEITATDISHEILNQARTAQYSQFEVQRGLPITYLMNYFTQGENEKWHLKDEIRNMVKFDYFNLLDPMTRLGQFDVIFCRNVLIYFDNETKGEILGNMSKQMFNDGFLFLGGAETVIGITDNFVSIPDRRGLYALQGSKHLNSKAA